ncbi:MAG: VOC family protein [Candidatus Eremiobacteraeota bacterium]|nr:VOC family protein [Candidatus Eremiobacteraeota bacterium]
MAGVTGVGGVFFKSKNAAKLLEWYRDRLGVPVNGSSAEFPWMAGNKDDGGCTVWAVFDDASEYFEPTAAPFMINFRVDDLDALLADLAAHGVWIDERREEYPYGRFAWIRDPDGNRIELWEPH